MTDFRLTPWASPEPPTQESLILLMHAEGLHPYLWSSAPQDLYPAHTHPFDKIMYCVSGSITFGLAGKPDAMTLHAGDRLDLPAGTEHDAVVGEQGVVCLEAHI